MMTTDCYIGEIRIFAGNYAPEGWALCDGQLLTVAANQALFSLLGATFGGDGHTTFALPDLRGRVPVHQGAAPDYSLGTKGGLDMVSLSAASLPIHSHALYASTNAAGTAGPAANLLPATSNKGFYTPGTVTGFKTETLASATLGYSGGTQAHDNSMPSMPLNYIIALSGFYPQQS